MSTGGFNKQNGHPVGVMEFLQHFQASYAGSSSLLTYATVSSTVTTSASAAAVATGEEGEEAGTQVNRTT